VLSPGDYIDVVLMPDFSSGVISGNVTCPTDTIVDVGYMSSGTSTARCIAINSILPTNISMALAGVTNPGTTGSYGVFISTNDSFGVIKESITAMVAIVDTVSVSASVAASLTFKISPVSTSTNVNGIDTTISSATSTLEFGTLTVGTSTVAGQELSVTTNADDGYFVTVEQDQNLTSNSGTDIDAFVDGTTTTPLPWQAPANSLDREWTYGHLGITTEDATLSSGDTFGTNLWEGLSSSTPLEVMYHDGPADGMALDKGVTRVAYQLEVAALQEAGDYYNTLTYIATPSY
jgi:hypothetical protein